MNQNRKAFIADWIKPSLQGLKPYHVQDANGFIKLDAMENPYTWSDKFKAEFAQALSQLEINRYPDPHCQQLKSCMRQVLNIPSDADLMLGNGSDELIQILAMASQPHRKIMAPEPSFVMYKMISQYLGMEYIGVPLTEDFQLDQEAMLAAIAEHQPGLIFIAYPNNPSGNLFDRDSIKRIVQASRGLVVIDEAYQIFSEDSFLNDLSQYDNVILMRTLSKVGLAGLRLGYLVGQKDWLEQFEKIRLPYNINTLTQASAQFFLKHYTELLKQAEEIKKSRTQLYQALNKLSGISVFPSQANFLSFKLKSENADTVFKALVKEKILIKKLHGSHPLLDQCLRVTVGLKEENEAFLSSLARVV